MIEIERYRQGIRYRKEGGLSERREKVVGDRVEIWFNVEALRSLRINFSITNYFYKNTRYRYRMQEEFCKCEGITQGYPMCKKIPTWRVGIITTR